MQRLVWTSEYSQREYSCVDTTPRGSRGRWIGARSPMPAVWRPRPLGDDAGPRAEATSPEDPSPSMHRPLQSGRNTCPVPRGPPPLRTSRTSRLHQQREGGRRLRPSQDRAVASMEACPLDTCIRSKRRRSVPAARDRRHSPRRGSACVRVRPRPSSHARGNETAYVGERFGQLGPCPGQLEELNDFFRGHDRDAIRCGFVQVGLVHQGSAE